ncbi:MAG TPA: cytochrome b/b6 domain-containing protein [Bryobacteraceae bacterium]|jgi:thiosulfate reductase cytochrome b subunit
MLLLSMAEFAYVPRLAITSDTSTSDILDSPRHSGLVRITHWIFTLSFFGLLVSGFAIILAHPHFYWGETGGIGTPSLFDLPLPTMLGGPSGWGRSLHFLSAWIAVLSGSLYAVSGILTQHFRVHLLPSPADLSWRSLRASLLDHLRLKRPAEEDSYNVLQRLSYVIVIFVVFPMIIVTGLAMSPVITSMLPQIVIVFGGHQTARTVHFFLADSLILFLAVHVAMVIHAGFASRMRAMITGRTPAKGGVS